MLFNPLLEYVATPKSYREQWADVVDSVCSGVERAVRRNDMSKAVYWLNVLDLVDSMTALWWREAGIDFYLEGVKRHEEKQDETETAVLVQNGGTESHWTLRPEISGVSLDELAHRSGQNIGISLI